MASSSPSGRGISRRGFLLGAAVGLGVGIPLTWLVARRLPPLLPERFPVSPDDSTQRAGRSSSSAMPGAYPGRVIEVHHPEAVSSTNAINKQAVSLMVDHGMAELTGYDPGDPLAWKTLFHKDDVIGIKVNPVGRKSNPGETGRVHKAVGSISSFELLEKVVRRLQQIGVPAKNIVVFERYANEFCEVGYKNFVERELPGVRWLCASLGYSGQQLDIKGFDPDTRRMAVEVEKNVVGYDPDVFATMGYCLPEHSPRDDRRFRSHLSVIVSRLISKMITLPVLKDHRSAGVTLALKNMSHGMNNNVSRSHLANIVRGGLVASGDGTSSMVVLGPNQCNTFIPQAVAQNRLREKATLHILDGLIGVYEGGPGAWNRTWGTWRRKSIFFATDPVALDHVCWDIIDTKRAEEGWAPVERMGLLYQTPATSPASATTVLAANHPLAAITLDAATMNLMAGRTSESFNVRQPDHIMLAGQLGLGTFDREQITYRRTIVRG